MAAYLNFNAFINEENVGASAIGALFTDPGNWFIFGTSKETLGPGGPGNVDANMIIKDFTAAPPTLAAAAAKMPGTWGGFNNTVTVVGLAAVPMLFYFNNNSITDTIQNVRLYQTGPPGIDEGRVASLVEVIVGQNIAAAGGAAYVRLAQLALPDVIENEAARDLITAISKPDFDKQVTIFLNAKSICCKTFYDFICKITDIIYDKKRINIWHGGQLVVQNGVKTPAAVDLKCDGVALTCKNGLSTAKHSVFTEELSYMYSEVVRLITNHHNMLNSGFAGADGPNLAAVTPLETALNKFKNFLAVLLRYDYLIQGNTLARKERFRVQAAHALVQGLAYMADSTNAAAFGFENYLYNTGGAIAANSEGCRDFFANYVAATPLSFFTGAHITKIHEFMIEQGNINNADMTAVLGASVPGLLQGIANPSCKNFYTNIVAFPAAGNAGGAVGAVNTYLSIFQDATGVGVLIPAGAPIPAVNAALLNQYTRDMSIVGSASDIHNTCARIAEPGERYGVGYFAAVGGVPGAGEIAVLNDSAKGLTYKQFTALLLMQLISGYDKIVEADTAGAAIRPLAGAGLSYPIAADSLLARTYYMSELPSLFRSGAGARQTVAQPDAILIVDGATPISQSIVRWIVKCLE